VNLDIDCDIGHSGRGGFHSIGDEVAPEAIPVCGAFWGEGLCALGREGGREGK